MKKLFLIFGAIFLVSFAFAQQIAKQTDFSKIEKRIEKSTAEINNPKKGIVAKTWINRGNLMRETYEAMLLSTRLDMPETEFTLIIGKPKEKKQEVIEEQVIEVLVMDRTNFYFIDGKLNSWEYTKPVFNEPLKEALTSYKKALELDQKGRSQKELKENLTKLKYNFISEGLNFYNRKNFSASHDYFVKGIEIGKMPIVSYIDTALIYYAGLSAQLSGKNEEAIELYIMAIDYKFSAEGNVYFNIYDAFSSLGKPEEGLKFLEIGFTRFPKNLQLLYGLINYYITKGEDPNKVLGFIQTAKEQEPDNASLFFAEGTLYDKLDNFDMAKKSYIKAIELNPLFFDAMYNLGALHYNKGVKFIEEANKLPVREFAKIDALEAKAKEEFKASIPYMEKASQINPTDKASLESLKNLYFRFRNEGKEYMDKYNEVVSKLEQL